MLPPVLLLLPHPPQATPNPIPLCCCCCLLFCRHPHCLVSECQVLADIPTPLCPTQTCYPLCCCCCCCCTPQKPAILTCAAAVAFCSAATHTASWVNARSVLTSLSINMPQQPMLYDALVLVLLLSPPPTNPHKPTPHQPVLLLLLAALPPPIQLREQRPGPC